MMRLLLIAGFLAAITGWNSGIEVTATDTPQLTEADCPDYRVQSPVDCFYLTVPERRDREGSKYLNIAVTVLRSSAVDKEPDPVLYVAGGPGEAGSAEIDVFAQSAILANRDIVLVDPRGTGRSSPTLTCPEVNEVRVAVFGTADPPNMELTRFRSAVRNCADRLRSEGIDLDAYNSREVAADLADLRLAMGIESWNVYAVSYGTRPALEMMRSAPEGIRSVVLDSAYPPDELETRTSVAIVDVQTAFDHLFEACASDPGCDSAFPNLSESFITMVTRYNEKPYVSSVMLPGKAERAPVRITGADLAAFVFLGLKDQSTIPALPILIDRFAAGDDGAIEDAIVPLLEQALIDDAAVFSLGAQLSIDCVDTGGFDTPEDQAIRDDPGVFGTMLLFSSGSFCDDWGVTLGPQSFNRSVVSALPTLLVAGSFDPVSLPASTQQAAVGLSSSTYMELPAAGHAPTFSDACAADLMLAFFNDPDSPLNADCALIEPGPAWVTEG